MTFHNSAIWSRATSGLRVAAGTPGIPCMVIGGSLASSRGRTHAALDASPLSTLGVADGAQIPQESIGAFIISSCILYLEMTKFWCTVTDVEARVGLTRPTASPSSVVDAF